MSSFCILSENYNLHKNVEKLESELIELKEKYEDLKISKQDAVRELLQLKDTHNDVVTHIKADLMNENTFREDVDRRLADVRAQVEEFERL
jgi:predicted RNase H-like nuclease (RuvC/YqgF family)